MKKVLKTVIPVLALGLLAAVLSACGGSGEHVHKEVIDKAVAATCQKEGLTEGSHCSECGEVVKKQETVAKTDHNLEPTVELAPTCTSAGFSSKSECTMCGAVTEAEQEIPAKGHTVVVDEAVKATCIKDGLTRGTHCSACGEVLITQRKVTDGDHVWSEKTAKDSKTNLSYTSCSECKKKQAVLPKINISTKLGVKIDREYVESTVTVSDCADSYKLNGIAAKVKVRGNGTAQLEKKPYRIKFDKKQKMLGLNDGLKAKNWVLLAEHNDRSLSKNLIAFTLGNDLLTKDGYYISDCCYVEVYVNSEYLGVYLLAEQQQVNPGRVDVYEPTETDGVNIGYLVEMDEYADGEEFHFEMDYRNALKGQNGTSIPKSCFENKYTIKNDIYSKSQSDYIKKHMQNAYDVIYAAVYGNHTNLQANPYKTLDKNGNIVTDTSIKSAKAAVSKVIDINSLVDTFILNEIMLDVDIGWSSFFISLDKSGGGNGLLTFEAPWDFDWALTCHDSVQNVLYSCNRHNFHTAYNHVNVWLVILGNQDWFFDAVEARWATFRKAKSIENCQAMLNSYASVMEYNFERNFELWPNALEAPGFNASVFNKSKSQKAASAVLVKYLEKRVAFLDSAFGYKK